MSSRLLALIQAHDINPADMCHALRGPCTTRPHVQATSLDVSVDQWYADTLAELLLSDEWWGARRGTFSATRLRPSSFLEELLYRTAAHSKDVQLTRACRAFRVPPACFNMVEAAGGVFDKLTSIFQEAIMVIL